MPLTQSASKLHQDFRYRTYLYVMLTKGWAGCVFRPPVNLENYEAAVGKVFYRNDSEDMIAAELAQHRNLNKISPRGTWYIHLLKVCQVSVADVMKRDIQGLCPVDLKDESRTLTQFVLEDGGQSLGDILKTDPRTFGKVSAKLTPGRAWKIITAFPALLRGLNNIAKRGFSHCDLHAYNVVYDGERLRVIDFAIHRFDKKSHFGNPKLTFLPPEVFLAVKKNLRPPIKEYRQSVIGYSPKQAKDMILMYKQTKGGAIIDSRKIDVFSCGSLMLQVLESGDLTVKNCPLSHKVRTVVSRMIAFNPNDRLTFNEAARELSDILLAQH